MYSNVMRFLSEEGLPARQLPKLSGISKPVVSIMVNVLERYSQVVISPDSTDSRTKLVRLTQSGWQNRNTYQQRLADVEQYWKTQFGEDTINHLRASLEAIVGQFDSELPYYPMALSHRGGTPTGH